MEFKLYKNNLLGLRFSIEKFQLRWEKYKF